MCIAIDGVTGVDVPRSIDQTQHGLTQRLSTRKFRVGCLLRKVSVVSAVAASDITAQLVTSSARVPA